ncbi:MBL fold metallo-hydrolase [Thermococcus aggregans]|uniref:MBL fold metallo-hydrolase n=1 Tax=Thermococcus aggregans TaxID=110163 RepID=UPI00264655A2|nr:MBL fold metallo-hydrolase [Thermococcus aggregans]
MDVGTADKLRIYVLAEDYAGYNSPFLAQHGISFLIEVKFNGNTRRILFDVGSYAEPVLFNMELLSIDPKTVDMIILSHSHFDHTGGLLGIMKKINKEVPIFAHPEIFKVSFATEPEFTYAGIPPLRGGSKGEIEKLGGIWVLSRDPIRLMPGVFTLGEVSKEEKVGFEKNVTISLYKLEKGRLVPDEVEDEIGLAINTKKGLVVIGGCSHPGIVSMTRKAIKISGIDQVYAVVGGFHLISADEERIQKTVEAFKELGVKKIYTGHCTGLRAEATFAREFGKNFEKLHSGKVIEI